MRLDRTQGLTPEGYELIADCFRVLAEPLRLRILHLLKEGEKNVGELVAHLDVSQPSVSKHLRVLLEADLVARRQEGTSAYFRIKDPIIFQLCELMCDSLETRLRAKAERAWRVFETEPHAPQDLRPRFP